MTADPDEGQPTTTSDGDELIAGRYRLISELGGGAMGVVWRARDEVLGRDVAVKQLRPDTGMSGAQVRQSHLRARREGRIAARLQHPNAVTIFDVAEHDGRPYLIMEYVPSSNLADILATGTVMAPTEVARIGAQLASALAAAHAVGIVHRDIKPGNVLMTADGTVKLTDFGISRATGDATVTATGEILGTPAYTAPEVAQGHAVDSPADVFSLGATLYAAVEGTPPFGDDVNAMAVLLRVVRNELRAPRRAGVLTDTMLRMLSPEPAMRPTMKDVFQAFEGLSARPTADELRKASRATATRLDSTASAVTEALALDALPVPLPKTPSAGDDSDWDVTPTAAAAAKAEAKAQGEAGNAASGAAAAKTPGAAAEVVSGAAAAKTPGAAGEAASSAADEVAADKPSAKGAPEAEAAGAAAAAGASAELKPGTARTRSFGDEADWEISLGAAAVEAAPKKPAGQKAAGAAASALTAQATAKPTPAPKPTTAPSSGPSAQVPTTAPSSPPSAPVPTTAISAAPPTSALPGPAPTTAMSSAASPPPADPRSRRRLMYAGGGVGAAAVIAAVVVALSGGGTDHPPTAPAAQPGTTPHSSAAPTTPAPSSAPTSSAAGAPASTGSSSSAASNAPGTTPASTPATPTAPTTPTTPTTPATSSTADVPTQLTAAITGYYGLVPGNLQAAWNDLTADYQKNKALGFANYQSFWQGMKSVSISGVQATGPDSVQATISYFPKNGQATEERTSFTLVQEGGVWKIARSSVVSSRDI